MTDGSIIAAIIVTQIPTYQPSPPRSVPGPASMPCMRSIVTSQATSAAASRNGASGMRRAVSTDTPASVPAELLSDAMTHGTPEPRVTTLELFFDLVFVFTITQLTTVLRE